MPNPITAQDLTRAGLSRSFAHHILAGSRVCGVPLALWLLDEFGLEVPPLAGRSPEEIASLRSIYSPAAPRSVMSRLESMADLAA
jgi:hypothetical protein